jgi:peptidoglycan/LPS O-acetylase OafA/YrhL
MLRTKKDGIINLLSDIFLDLSINSIDFYFFISSFLITSLALREYKYKNSFSLRNFYIRKILRIVPLLILALFFALFFHLHIIKLLQLTVIEKNSAMYYFLGIPNFLSDIQSNRFVYTTVIFSIYMVLQFYMIWGIILKFLKNQLVVVSIIFIALGVLIRLFLISKSMVFFFNPLSYGVSIGFGGLISYIIREKQILINQIKKLNKSKILVIYTLGLLSIIGLYVFSSKSPYMAFVHLITVPFYAFVIVEQTFCKKSIIKFRKLKIFNRLGRISYGLILLTPIVATVLNIAFESIDKGLESNLFKIIFVFATFVLTWFIADISYNSYEKLFRYIRRDFKRI